MNLHQMAATRAKAGRPIATTDRPGRSIREAKTGKIRTPRAKKKAAFLRAFAKTLSITLSARYAGIDRATHYEWLAKDAKYKTAFESKVRMAVDAMRDELIGPGHHGVFTPLIYKGRYCYAQRIRTLCQLEDGTSAFQDELPKGARVISRRMVITHDGEMIGRTKIDERALFRLAALMMPEKYGNAVRRKRKPRVR